MLEINTVKNGYQVSFSKYYKENDYVFNQKKDLLEFLDKAIKDVNAEQVREEDT